LALLRHGAVPDLSPECAPKRTVARASKRNAWEARWERVTERAWGALPLLSRAFQTRESSASARDRRAAARPRCESARRDAERDRATRRRDCDAFLRARPDFKAFIAKLGLKDPRARRGAERHRALGRWSPGKNYEQRAHSFKAFLEKLKPDRFAA
jgi:hypothetical protein